MLKKLWWTEKYFQYNFIDFKNIKKKNKTWVLQKHIKKEMKIQQKDIQKKKSENFLSQIKIKKQNP